MSSSLEPLTAPTTADASIRRTDNVLFWNLAATAYDVPEKEPGDVFLRVRGFAGTRGNRDIKSYPPLMPNAAELGGKLGSHNVKIGLWVGITTSTAAKYRTKAGAGKPRGEEAPTRTDKTGRWGKSVNDIIKSGSIMIIPKDPKTLRVVVNASSNESRVYALANPDETGLCEAIPIDTEEVWYAPEYRDDNEARLQHLRGAITRKIESALNNALNKSLENTARPKKYTATIPVDGQVAKFRQIKQLMSSYRVDGDVRHLESAYSILNDVKSDLNGRKIRDMAREQLDAVLHPKEPCSDQDIMITTIVIQNLYSKNAPLEMDVEQAAIRALADAIRANGETIRYRHLKFLVVDWVRKWRNGPLGLRHMSAHELGRELQESIFAAETILPTSQPIFPQDDDDEETMEFCKVFLTTQIRGLKSLLSKQRATTRELQEAAGKPTTTLDLKQIMERIVAAVDYDEVIKWANEGLNWVIHSVLCAYARDDSNFASYIEDLEKLAASYSEDDGAGGE